MNNMKNKLFKILTFLLLLSSCNSNNEVNELFEVIEALSDTSEQVSIKFSNIGCLCQYQIEGDWLGEELVAIDAKFNLSNLKEIYFRTGVPSVILEFDNAEVMHTFYNGKTEEKEPVIVLYFTDKAIFELENLLGQIYDTAINCNAKEVKKTIVQYK